MKTLTKILSAITLVTLSAGAVLAGPSNPSGFFTGTAPVRQAGGCPMIKAETRLATSANTKASGPVQQTTGYKHEGCTGASVAELKCGSSGASCAAMRQS